MIEFTEGPYPKSKYIRRGDELVGMISWELSPPKLYVYPGGWGAGILTVAELNEILQRFNYETGGRQHEPN